MGEVLLAPSAGVELVREVEAFLARRAGARGAELPAAWKNPVLADWVEQVRVVPADAAAEVLTGAIGLVARGWTRGRYQDANGFCLYGAIEAAAGGAGVEVLQVAKLCVELALAAMTGEINAIRWNDDVRRTRGEVLGLLGSAVTVARALGAR